MAHLSAPSSVLRTCFLLLAAGGALLAPPVLAHMEMKNPLAISSKYDPANNGNVDYSMTRPLQTNGGDFPCLGHLKDPSHITGVYTAGQSYPLELAGTATHQGGSCQISLSYDGGSTFRVIKSMIGNCPIPMKYTFTIPASAPATSDALLAWSWFNKVGNREMYMNCAHVSIAASASQSRHRRHHHLQRRATGLDSSFPPIFLANIFSGTAQGTCVTVEGKEVVFPNPGPDVEYGSEELKTAPPTDFPGCPASNSEKPSVGPGAGSGSGAVKAPAYGNNQGSAANSTDPPAEIHNGSGKMLSVPAPKPSLGTAPVMQPSASSAPAPANPTVTKPAITTSPALASPAASPPETHCGAGMIQCSESGDSWSMCSNGAWVPMGGVAVGTICRNSEIARKSDLGACSSEGTIQCLEGGSKWSVCTGGNFIAMGAVAEGTKCEGENLVASVK